MENPDYICCQRFWFKPMTQTQLDPEIREISQKIEAITGKQCLSVQECVNAKSIFNQTIDKTLTFYEAAQCCQCQVT